jgi:hypothetical protein
MLLHQLLHLAVELLHLLAQHVLEELLHLLLLQQALIGRGEVALFLLRLPQLLSDRSMRCCSCFWRSRTF